MKAVAPGIAAIYGYPDADGNPHYEVVRYEPKSFRQRRPDGHGGHSWSVAGLERVPYKLPSLRAHIEHKRTIVVCEGEKDADTLGALGVCATTNAGGANWHWTPEFVSHFRGAKQIIVIPDCDEGDGSGATQKGREAAAARAEMLLRVCSDVRVVDLEPDRHDGYDVTDWLADGHTIDDLKALIKKTPLFKPPLPSPFGATQPRSATTVDVVMRQLGEIEAQPVVALWKSRIFAGEPFVLAGPPGVGKSFISGAIAAAVSLGAELPGGGDITEAGDVIVLALEDDAGRVLRPRYEAMGADLNRVHIIEGVRVGEAARVTPFALAHIEALERALDRVPAARLIIIDPIASMLASADTFRSNEVREILDPFLDATSARGIAVCMVTHTNKSVAVSGAFRVEGSLGGFVGRARSVLAVGINAETGRRGVGLLKSNLGRLDVPVIGYEIDATGRFFWLGEDNTTTADQLFEQSQPGQDRSIGDEARDAILAALAAGEKTAIDLQKIVRSQGHKDRTIARQRSLLHKAGEIARSGGGVAGEIRWRLPDSSLIATDFHRTPSIDVGIQCNELAFNGISPGTEVFE